MTREERNVVLFVALGVLLGSVWGGRETGVRPSVVAPAESDSTGVVVVDLFPIDLNRAGPELLEELPGIGPTKARRIVAWREAHGRFACVEELVGVRGIGPRTVDRLRERVTVTAPAAADDSAAAVHVSREGTRVVQRSPRHAAAGARDPHSGAAGSGAEATEVVR